MFDEIVKSNTYTLSSYILEKVINITNSICEPYYYMSLSENECKLKPYEIEGNLKYTENYLEFKLIFSGTVPE